jgi:hypothetical protein
LETSFGFSKSIIVRFDSSNRLFSRVVLPVPRAPNRKKLLDVDGLSSLGYISQDRAPILARCPSNEFKIL